MNFPLKNHPSIDTLGKFSAKMGTKSRVTLVNSLAQNFNFNGSSSIALNFVLDLVPLTLIGVRNWLNDLVSSASSAKVVLETLTVLGSLSRCFFRWQQQPQRGRSWSSVSASNPGPWPPIFRPWPPTPSADSFPETIRAPGSGGNPRSSFHRTSRRTSIWNGEKSNPLNSSPPKREKQVRLFITLKLLVLSWHDSSAIRGGVSLDSWCKRIFKQ